MTGERLFGWRGAPPDKLPESVRRWAGEAKAGFGRLRPGGQPWMVVCSQRTQQTFYLASRDPGGGAGQVLRLLGELLDQLDEEQAASQQFGEELRLALNQLDFLSELARIVAQGDDLPVLFARLAKALRQLTSAEESGLILRQERGVVAHLSGAGDWQSLAKLATPAQCETPIAVLQRDVDLPAELEQALPDLNNLVLLSVPVDGAQDCLLVLLNHPNAQLQISEQELLLSVAEQIGLVVNTTLARQAREAARRIEHEVEIAGQIQSNLLPTHLPSLPGLDFAANLKPAYRVGGDLYDVQPLEDGLAIMVGDVAGKGIPAAMLTALIHATLKSEVQHHCEPAELLRSINRLIYEELDRSGTFITAFLAVLQTNPLRLSYASAGHTAALLWRSASQDVLQLGSTGMPLGIHQNLELEQSQLTLEPGDVLVLYSDGITEAENEQGRVLGMQALVDLLLATHPAPAQAQLGCILEALELHRRGLSLRDDVVLFLVRVEDPASPQAQVLPFVRPAEARTVRDLALQARQVGGRLKFATSARRAAFINELELAVSEITTNVVTHAYGEHPLAGRVQGRFTLYPDRVHVDMIDNGATFQPAFDATVDVVEFSPSMLRKDPPVSGYGLIIASHMLDVCQYAHLPNGRNHWHLEKIVPAQ